MAAVISKLPTTSFVLYLRVSTQKQGEKGNGLAAQHRDLDLFLGGQPHHKVLETFTEVESGACGDRPQLQDAITLCRATGAHLLVQKVDRLSRDVEFIARLVKDRNLTIRVANLPNADNFQIHLFAALGQAEREFISQRTKAAMAAAKARGQRFGNPKLIELNKTRKRASRAFASGVSHLVLPLRNQGMTYQQIADTLNSMGQKTAKGCSFHPIQVKRILDRTNQSNVG